jgi:hypothetical protein
MLLEQLLKDPAFAALYKNAPHLNNVEVQKLTSGGILPTNHVIPTVVQKPTILPTVENIPPSKNGKGKWILPVIILVGSFYAFYKIRNWMQQENEKSKKNKN